MARLFTKASKVGLELNGKTVGDKILTEDDKYIAVFKIPYQSGELKAIALDNEAEVARKTMKTFDNPATIKLSSD